MSRKRKYNTDEERMEARRQAVMRWYHRNRKSGRKRGRPPKSKSETPKPQADKSLILRLERLESDMEKIKWELYGRKI